MYHSGIGIPFVQFLHGSRYSFPYVTFVDSSEFLRGKCVLCIAVCLYPWVRAEPYFHPWIPYIVRVSSFRYILIEDTDTIDAYLATKPLTGVLNASWKMAWFWDNVRRQEFVKVDGISSMHVSTCYYPGGCGVDEGGRYYMCQNTYGMPWDPVESCEANWWQTLIIDLIRDDKTMKKADREDYAGFCKGGFPQTSNPSENSNI
ncbi:Twin-arginine translocation pathway signal [Striga asiatica]|uniref:Twin-arginine translocation pathway signal n=1 Tax=Striga asiatica TaxID=4170 RepID=A0A5A7PR84_STRAF|nr:Twin-arginine translocation pathway signal [Striga asiatica]